MGGLRDGGLGENQHHGSLRHRRAHNEGLLNGGGVGRGRLGEDGCSGGLNATVGCLNRTGDEG